MDKIKRVREWKMTLLICSVFVAAIGWLFITQSQLSAKVYQQETRVVEYKDSIETIHTKLGRIENDLEWIKKYLDPYNNNK